MMVVAGAAAAWITLVIIWDCRTAFAGPGPAGDDPASRLAYAARWLLLPGFYREAIDGTRTPASHALEINLRYNQNTVEQVLLAAIAWCGLAAKLPQAPRYLLSMMALVFPEGRITFFIGYLIHPFGRAYGMVLTVVPTLVAYGWLAERLMQQG